MTIESSPEASVYLDEFFQRHSLDRNSVMENEIKAIYWVSAANVLVNQGYANLTEDDFSREPAIGLLLNLLHRAFEHMEGAVVAFTTGSGASSEALSRVTAELSVSILYILAGQRESRLLAFLESYVHVEEKRLRNWLKEVESLSGPAKKEHVRGIERRRSAVVAITKVLTTLRDEIVLAGVTLMNESWPNVSARFEAIGDTVHYRTVYSRMSSLVHSDAEETIRYFMGSICDDPKIEESMALETMWFSKFMLYFAVDYFLQASSAYARCYGMKKELLVALDRGLRVIRKELSVIAKNVG